MDHSREAGASDFRSPQAGVVDQPEDRAITDGVDREELAINLLLTPERHCESGIAEGAVNESFKGAGGAYHFVVASDPIRGFSRRVVGSTTRIQLPTASNYASPNQVIAHYRITGKFDEVAWRAVYRAIANGA